MTRPSWMCAKRSTSSFTRFAQHLIVTSKNAMATSFGEAQFYALTKVRAVLSALLPWWPTCPKVLKPKAREEASASKGIASRRGAGEASPHPGPLGP